MDALLLAGGFGTRLRPLTYTTPKPLLPVGGRPMLEYVLDRLPEGVNNVVVAVNWLAEVLEAYFEAREDDGRTYTVVRESEPLGTAGAVANCLPHLKGDRAFVLNGDILSEMDLQDLLDQHLETEALATISTRSVEPAEVVHFGVIRPDEEDERRIRGFVEKPKDPTDAPSTLINAGAYLLERSVLEEIPTGRMVSMEQEIFPTLLDRAFFGCEFEGAWIDVGTPERLLHAQDILGLDDLPEGAEIADDALLANVASGPNLRVGSDAWIENCVIGRDVTIEEGVVLRNCVIGDGEIVSSSQDDARIGLDKIPDGYPNKQVGNALNA